jgi:hypothetical protein
VFKSAMVWTKGVAWKAEANQGIERGQDVRQVMENVSISITKTCEFFRDTC